jgi:iron complex transport system substrate-binding protein
LPSSAHITHRSPLRIVSLAPSASSILCAIGARRSLVAVSKWCKDVVPVGGLPQVGDCWKLDVDEVMRLKPTLLIGSVPFAPETVTKLLEQPVAFLALNPRSLADVESDIRLLANLVNRTAAGQKVIAQMRGKFRDLARDGAKRRGKRAPRVYCEAWPNPRISSPPWVAELVKLAGGEFVVPAGKRISDEEVARANPDIIILAWAAAGDRAEPSRAIETPAWQGVGAVRNRRVVVIRDELLNTPGPPLALGARELIRALYGDPGHPRTSTRREPAAHAPVAARDTGARC